MNILKTFFLCLIILLSLRGFSQDNEMKFTNYKHSIGINAGTSTGLGLTYRYFPEYFGFQISYAPITSRDSYQHLGGISLFLRLTENEKNSFFMYQGNFFIYETNRNNNGSYKYEYFYVNNGFGFGISHNISKRINFNFMGGLAMYDNLDYIFISLEASLFYYLK